MPGMKDAGTPARAVAATCWIVAGAILLAALLAGSSARPAAGARPGQAQEIELSAEAGFDGYAKVGAWIPVRITLRSAEPVDGQVVVEVPAAGARYAMTVSLSSPAERRLTLHVPPASVPIEVKFVSGGQARAQTAPYLRILSRADRLVLVVSDPPDGYSFLNDLPTPFGGSTRLAQMRIAQLPDRAAALSTLDAIVFSNVDTASLTRAQQGALRAWIVGGGHLILGGGPGALLTAGGLPGIAPAQASSALLATPMDSLLALARPDALAPLEEPASGALVPAVALAVISPDAAALAGSRETPLIVRRQIGRGLVDQLAFDPTLSPLRDWSGRGALFASLFAGRVDIPNSTGELRDAPSAGMAARAISVEMLPNIIVIAGFLLLYVLCLGPLNYLALRRISRLSWAWVTLPLLVAGFTLLGLATGFRLRGNEPHLHRLSLVSGDARMAGGPSYNLTGLFAPRRNTLDLSAGRNLPVEVEPREERDAALTVAEGEPTWIENIGLDGGETRVFYGLAEEALPEVRADLAFVPQRGASEPARILGEIINTTGAAFTGCALVAGHDYQAIGTLGANQRVQAEVSLVFGRPQSAVNFSGLQAGGAYDAGFAVPRQSSPASSATPASYGEPFDLSGASMYDALIGWRDYSGNRLAAIAEGGFVGALFAEAGARLGDGVMLACWEATDRSGIAVDGARVTDRGLRAWRLPVRNYLPGSASIIPPDAFAWSLRASSSSARPDASGLILEPGQHVFGFTPWFGVRAGADATVTVEYTFGDGTRLSSLDDTSLWLYEWDSAQYIQVVGGAMSNDARVSATGAFVSPAGELRVRVDNPARQVSLSNLQVSFQTP